MHLANALGLLGLGSEGERAWHYTAKVELAQRLGNPRASTVLSDGNANLVFGPGIAGSITDCAADLEVCWPRLIIGISGAEHCARFGDYPEAIFDILVRRGGSPFAAIEVFASHGVDNKKARIIAAAGLWLVEVRATEVITAFKRQTGQAILLNCSRVVAPATRETA